MTEQKCSRAGCQQSRSNLIIWRNPRIHKQDRTKTWGACPEHLDYLVDYLSQRNFFLEQVAIEKEDQ
jgi:hypothetical protein